MKAKERYAIMDAIERLADGIKTGVLPASETSGALKILCGLFEYGDLISLIDSQYLQVVKDYGVRKRA